MPHFLLKINLDNEAWLSGGNICPLAVSTELRVIADQIAERHTVLKPLQCGVIADVNGNRCGSWTIHPGKAS